MYNVPTLSARLSGLADLSAAQALFPRGQRLAIIEPFFKVMMDGTPGVRVDNPAEVSRADSWSSQPSHRMRQSHSDADTCKQHHH